MKFKDFLKSPIRMEPHYFVVGHPISHSLSPLMHRYALNYHQISANYLAIDLFPDDLSTFLAWCNREPFLGANVTIPYKETLFAAVDEHDPVSADLGVINTICKNHGMLKGYNTDLFGFVKPLEGYRDLMENASAIVFGSGGAGRAAIAGLVECGITDITVVSRRPGLKMEGLPDSGMTIRMTDYSNWTAYGEEAAVIVNATPLGLSPELKSSPVSEHEAIILNGKICYDLVYNPMITRFLKLSEKHGGISVNGLEMLIWQGSRSFELWTGKSFPFEDVKKVLLTYFER